MCRATLPRQQNKIYISMAIESNVGSIIEWEGEHVRDAQYKQVSRPINQEFLRQGSIFESVGEKGITWFSHRDRGIICTQRGVPLSFG